MQKKTYKIKEKSPLSKGEISRLVCLIREFNDWIINKRKENKLAELIQFPKTPPQLSENLALQLMIDGEILNDHNLVSFRLDNNTADIIATTNKGDEVTVEIKATVKDFQSFGLKDIKANYLIWMDLSNLILRNIGSINIHLLPNPGAFFSKPCKIGLKPFLVQTEGGKRTDYIIDIFQYLK